MVACAHAENSIRKYEENTYLAVVICCDATVFHNASATRCDVFVDLWEDRGAHHDGQAWASWWVFDGGDDMAHLQRMDVVGKLNDQVKNLEAEGGIEVGGTPKKLLCVKSGDGKVMMSGSCGKCWNCNLKYDQFQAHLFAIADFPVLPRIGSLMSCIPPVRNVGDVAHCCASVGIGIGKRLKDSARTWGSPGALRAVSHFISNLRQEAKHIPVAERVMRAPSKEKEHTLDINTSRLFFFFNTRVARRVGAHCCNVLYPCCEVGGQQVAQNQCRPAPHVAGLLPYAKDLAPCGSCSHGVTPTLCMHGYTIHQGMGGTGVECFGLGALGGVPQWGTPPKVGGFY